MLLLAICSAYRRKDLRSTSCSLSQSHRRWRRRRKRQQQQHAYAYSTGILVDRNPSRPGKFENADKRPPRSLGMRWLVFRFRTGGIDAGDLAGTPCPFFFQDLFFPSNLDLKIDGHSFAYHMRCIDATNHVFLFVFEVGTPVIIVCQQLLPSFSASFGVCDLGHPHGEPQTNRRQLVVPESRDWPDVCADLLFRRTIVDGHQ